MDSPTPNVPGPGDADPGLADATASIRAIGEDLEPSGSASASASGERFDNTEAGEDD